VRTEVAVLDGEKVLITGAGGKIAFPIARIHLHPDRPNNFNPIYEDDYVRLGIRAMEAAQCPPLVVNWAGSETVSAEGYCAYMGELIGVGPTFEYTPAALPPRWPDVTHMHEVLGPTEVHWGDGFRRMIEARHPDLKIAENRSTARPETGGA
jgi:UDP-glucuronate 4-epimerase